MSEQRLVDDLTAEAIKIYGQDMFYVKREDLDDTMVDEFLGEDRVSQYRLSYPIEMYIAGADFDGRGDLMAKFGMQINEQATFVANRRRFSQMTGLPLPREGDLVFVPMANALFEVKYVDIETPFYQLGKLHTVNLVVETFQYSQDVFDTGMDNLDSVNQDRGFIVDFTMTAGGVGTFELNEAVSVGASSSGKVHDWNADTNLLQVYDFIGATPTSGEIIGSSTGASWAISSSDDFVMHGHTGADNKNIEVDGDDITVWDATHPFGDNI